MSGIAAHHPGMPAPAVTRGLTTAPQGGSAAVPEMLKGSLKIGTLAGIGVYVHATFLLLVAWVGLTQWFGTHRVDDVVSSLGLLAALFTCVVLHELGHALAARRFGIATREITLLPIGGIARMDRTPDAPPQALLVALAGPAVNFAIAGALFGVLRLAGLQPETDWTHLASAPFLTELLFVNVMLATFNLLPAFPMDGGRALQALLTPRLGRVRATQMAARLGQWMAFVFGILGALGDPVLLFIALFVWLGATQEAFTVELRSALDGMTAGDFASSDYWMVNADDRVADVAVLMIQTLTSVVAVARDGEVLGLLTRTDVLHAIKRGRDATAGDLVRDLPPLVVDTGTKADELVTLLERGRGRAALVQEGGRVAGFATMDGIIAFLALFEAAGARARTWLRHTPAA